MSLNNSLPESIAWFKTNFGKPIEKAIAGTPFSLDMLAAIACQETRYIWARLVDKKLPLTQVLRLCVGDTLDADKGRGEFPETKAVLLAAPRGQEMFDIARAVLLEMAEHVPGFGFANGNKKKFCHGFGIFQYDLQFFEDDPDYFLDQKWADFDACLGKCVEELFAAMKRIGWQAKTTLTDTEKVYVAIAYNAGSVKPSKGFKQGHESDGRYYGENIWEYLNVSAGVQVESGGTIGIPAGTAPIPKATVVEVVGRIFKVDVRETPLNLRSEANVPKVDPTSNIVGKLPDGHLVHCLAGKKTDEWMEVDTTLNGAYKRGFAASKFLMPAVGVTALPVVEVATELPKTGIVAVYMPRKAGTVTTRTAIAGAHSLNEAGQPGRKATTAEGRCAELAAIISWLAVDDDDHKRYQPRDGSTFCNIYAHDYCTLAGVYLPRVWWLPNAIAKLAKGETVEPLYESTIDEQRANDLFRWFKAFGAEFGWRQTGSLTKLQEAANLGAIGIIVARRKEDGKSGHIVAVVPETGGNKAKRDSNGEVIAPLQSQAGSNNFQYGTSKVDWWLGSQFADSGFWIHA